MSRIISDEIKNIIDEIELLISDRKKIEKDFEQLRKKLLIGKKTFQYFSNTGMNQARYF